MDDDIRNLPRTGIQAGSAAKPLSPSKKPKPHKIRDFGLLGGSRPAVANYRLLSAEAAVVAGIVAGIAATAGIGAIAISITISIVWTGIAACPGQRRRTQPTMFVDLKLARRHHIPGFLPQSFIAGLDGILAQVGVLTPATSFAGG